MHPKVNMDGWSQDEIADLLDSLPDPFKIASVGEASVGMDVSRYDGLDFGIDASCSSTINHALLAIDSEVVEMLPSGLIAPLDLDCGTSMELDASAL